MKLLAALVLVNRIVVKVMSLVSALFAVYDLQQQAPKPKKILCQKEVGDAS